jgi:hypothetical protein
MTGSTDSRLTMRRNFGDGSYKIINFVAADVSPLIISAEKFKPTHIGCYGEWI